MVLESTFSNTRVIEGTKMQIKMDEFDERPIVIDLYERKIQNETEEGREELVKEIQMYIEKAQESLIHPSVDMMD